MLLRDLLNLTDFLANCLGPKYEITVYEVDFTREGKVIDIKNNYISKQTINSLLPKFISEAILNNEFVGKSYKEFLVSSSNEESIIKTALLYIKNNSEVFDYLLSISSYHEVNYGFKEDTLRKSISTNFNQVTGDSKHLNILNHINSGSVSSQVLTDKDIHNKSIEEVIKEKIEEVLLDLGIESSNLTFAQKSNIVGKLCEAEIFSIKNSIKIVSGYLNISISSIYRYIRQHSKKVYDDDTTNFLM